MTGEFIVQTGNNGCGGFFRSASSGTVFHYVPNEDVAKNEFITGRIGRRCLVPENEPPEAGFAEVERPAWKAGEIVIDPRHHSDGQKAAIEIAAANPAAFSHA